MHHYVHTYNVGFVDRISREYTNAKCHSHNNLENNKFYLNTVTNKWFNDDKLTNKLWWIRQHEKPDNRCEVLDLVVA